MAVGVILVAALPAAAASVVAPTYPYSPSEAYQSFKNLHTSIVQLYEAKPNRFGIYSNYMNGEGCGFTIVLFSSTEPFKFSEGFLWVEHPENVTVTLGSGYRVSRNGSFYWDTYQSGTGVNAFLGSSDIRGSSWSIKSPGDMYSGWQFVNMQFIQNIMNYNPDIDGLPVYNYNNESSVWWVYENSSEMLFYTYPSDSKPIGSITEVSGGTGVNYENFYGYDYEVDENGEYVPGSGNINFDFGAGDKVKSFFNKGFFGEIRTWIKEGNDGAQIEPMTLFNFDVDYKNHHWHSDGFTLDFSDRNSFVSLLAFIVFPVYAFEILCNLWGLAFKILTGVPLWHITGSSITDVPLTDNGSEYLL